jgi:hypothetical protein
MKMANLILGLVAISIAVSQHAEAQAFITRVYYGSDFENYSLDPPFWSQGSVVIFQAVSLSTTSPAKKTVIRLGVDRVTLTLNRRVDSPFGS